jgi:hypothetical protein
VRPFAFPRRAKIGKQVQLVCLIGRSISGVRRFERLCVDQSGLIAAMKMHWTNTARLW